ncbi:GNAT family N-acetyltransferase [Pseudodesulfovibrio cashew]|uniref:GNAT family N-acetyltransferase n=1 Tax=Pseudodesulfovibrio cashew TaxID=2678688 RepID=A0A6I6JFX0_9BACT|nr:N-acetyltransferase [Pseudodesulfovibrio cashew]QGY41071.1 GNAT family N-acetyltransferase [Pseudodesulfovibrio cashew]
MHIRKETREDERTIERIQYAAFKDHPMHAPGAEPQEPLIVSMLRADGALEVSLLAEEEGTAVGHIALSSATVGEDAAGWFLLGPVGVLPAHQKQGIGSALIREAIRILKLSGAAGIVLVGDPGYYGRFGFASVDGLTWEGVPSQFVLALPLGEANPKGRIMAHAAFYTQ